MASVQNSVQNSQTSIVQHNHVIIQYQQPPDSGNSKPHFRNIGSRYKKLCSKECSADTIYPGLYRPNSSIFYELFIVKVHSGSCSRECLLQFPIPSIHHLLCSNLQQLLNELSSTQSTSLKSNDPLEFKYKH